MPLLTLHFCKILTLVFIAVILLSCSASKRLQEGQLLLYKNKIIVNEKKAAKEEIYSYLKQSPNTKILGIPLSLHIYNLANPNYKLAFDSYLKRHPKMENTLNSIFSEKQVKGMDNAYESFNKWFLKNGNPPVLLDSAKMEKSALALRRYYQSKGYFNTEVHAETDIKPVKKAEVIYNVTTHEPYYIDSLFVNINTPILDSIYKQNTAKTLVKKGERVDYAKMEQEEQRLISVFRNNGIYHFGNSNMEFWLDTLNTDSHKADVYLKIYNRAIEKDDSVYTKPFEIKRVTNVNVFTDFSFANKDLPIKDSAFYNGYMFYATNKLSYNPKYLSNAIIITPGGVYKDTERNLTRQYLRELQNFNPGVDIKYIENNDGSLMANIYVSPLKKQSLSFDLDVNTSNIKPFGISGRVGWSVRNIFRGAEVLELSFQGSFLNSSKDVSDNSRFFNAWEAGTTANLRIPRIFFPLKTNAIIPKKMNPKTNLSVSVSLQKNIGLDRRNITGGINYNWQSNKYTNHTFDLLNIQYIKNLRVSNYFEIYGSERRILENIIKNYIPPQDITWVNENGKLIAPLSYINYVLDNSTFESQYPSQYNDVKEIKERYNILKEDYMVPVMSYTYNLNTQESFTDNEFFSFTGRLISSGNITSLLIKKPSNNESKKMFGVSLAQYIKPELEYKKYFHITSSNTLVFRTFLGAAFPAGTSNYIPFSRSYSAGGSNDVRAWNTFKLGPGSTKNRLEFNVGSFKLTSNLEYRFKLFNNFHSALFIDAGNIWDITNSNQSTTDTKFKGLNSIKEIAVGSGLGLRYDFTFLVLRFDIGLKTYEPYLLSKNKWFKNYNFNHAVYNIGINYPF